LKIIDISMISVFVGVSVISRYVLPFPNIKPNAFLAITGGLLLGPYAGFLIGALGMVVSDLFIGAGLWTLVTAGSMGLLGFLGGLFWHRRMNGLSIFELALGGYLMTLLYDIITSLWIVPFLSPSLNPSFHHYIVALMGLFLPVSGVPYPFGIVHETTTAILMATATPVIIRFFNGRFLPRGGVQN
jgi:uncharacterized membrane protein